MTARGYAMLIAGGGAAAWGWHAGWPEFTAMGAGAVALVVLCLLLVGPRPQAALAVPTASFVVTRGQPGELRLSVSARRRRWLRLVDGQVSQPRATVPLPRRGGDGEQIVRVPVDTSRRGVWPTGPFALLHGDPWSIRRGVAARADGGVVTVRPRTHAIRRSLLAQMTVAESELLSRRMGDQHFFALRDYVLGDEPRTVHWRSSARVGHLVVRQHVAAATTGTTVLLDTDGSAYGSDEQFGPGWLADRFEAAVEVAASVCAAQPMAAEQVHLATTTRAAAVQSADAGAANGLLDMLAGVDAAAPVATAPDELPAIVRRTRCARVVAVTGTPNARFVQALTRIQQRTPVLVVRVGAAQPSSLAGLRTLDIADAAELA